MTKDQIIRKVQSLDRKVKTLEYDNKALWNWCKCLQERLPKQEKKETDEKEEN